MAEFNYTLLKDALQLQTALSWLGDDAGDDFFRDPIDYRDLSASPTAVLERYQHRWLQLESFPPIAGNAIKAGGMLRPALWLHPVHRLLYLACLRHLFARIDARLAPGVYSYRLAPDRDLDAYPLIDRMDRWLLCDNDFREAALASDAGAVLITDIASYYDHISTTALCERVLGLLGSGATQADREIVSLLQRLLDTWSGTGFGIPQNYDPSSVLGNLYLDPIDQAMARTHTRYFRWLDDIRVVAKTRTEALRVLHALQGELARHNLFLSSAKTQIITRSEPAYDDLLDVADDILITESEEALASNDCGRISECVPRLMDRLHFHAGHGGHDRKFRAIANRLLQAASFKELGGDLIPQVHAFVLPRMTSHPHTSDYWVKLLRSNVTSAVLDEVRAQLVTEPSIYDWQRFHLWRLALHAEGADPILLKHALHASQREFAPLVAAQAIVYVGKHGSESDRESVFASNFLPQRPYPVQRAALIAIQELPLALRSRHFARAVAQLPMHQELVEYLTSRGPDYGVDCPATRDCTDPPRPAVQLLRRGIGLVAGEIQQFRLLRGDLEYE